MFYPARRSSLLIFLPNCLTSVSASAHVLSVPISLAFMSPSLCLFAHIYLLYYTLYTACPLSLLPFTSLLEGCALTMRFYSLSCPSLPITVYWFAFWVSVVTDTFPPFYPRILYVPPFPCFHVANGPPAWVNTSPRLR
ncbi:hypothetical protein FA13DRAFT_1272212 [Coprinellus micaceus]|uniref:Uncharacterized protein n=1 Tax=Coprinellus micaceus TaxID=71717 RepID=A0A4Y7SUT8_COPMI|nr:hypothetical protein FA13DRAFT_1272212 [Coprinellus micaceus]